MRLRSGKIKPSVPLCKCGKYWGSINHKNMCSVCYNHGTNYKKTFQNKLNDYVNSKITKDRDLLAALRFSSKSYQTQIMRDVLKILKYENKYITAKFARKLLRECPRDILERCHLVCSFVIDWWNITMKNGFNSHEMCYFGNFGEGLEDYKFPPRLPNRNMYRVMS